MHSAGVGGDGDAQSRGIQLSLAWFAKVVSSDNSTRSLKVAWIGELTRAGCLIDLTNLLFCLLPSQELRVGVP